MFKNGDGPHTNNFQLGQHGRNRSNVWTYAGINSFRAGRLDELSISPTVKPVALVANAMRDCSRRGDIVLDPFMGSGTTILAAERVGRRAFGLELDPLYVDAAVQAVAGVHQARCRARGIWRDFRRDRRRSCRCQARGGADDQEAGADLAASDGKGPKRDYSVGYKKPPKASQFPPGRSGNPKGRPKGSRNSDTIINSLLQRKVTLRENGKAQKITIHEGIIRCFVEGAALKGNAKSASFILDRYDAAQGNASLGNRARSR